jgi:2'-5' RNA ligase
MEKIRTFVCFELAAHVKEQIGSFIDRIRTDSRCVRWADPAGIHLTLKFLGDVDEASISRIGECVVSAKGSIEKILIRIHEKGVFPNPKRPRVLWLGIEEGSGNLAALQQRLEDELFKAGFPREEREFTPHLTIGRVRFQDGIHEVIRNFENSPFPGVDFQAEEVVVMRSDLRPSGAIYTPLRKYKLKPG